MRKFGLFAMSFAASVFIFAIVCVAVLLLSGAGSDIIDSFKGGGSKGGSDAPKLLVEGGGGAETETADGVATENGEGLTMLVIYSEPKSDETYFSECFVSAKDFVLDSRPLELDSETALEVSKLLDDGLINSAVDLVCRTFSVNTKNYIKFDGESFRKIADRMNGLVYNENGADVLLTGSQAVSRMDARLLSDACRQFYNAASKKNIMQEIMYIAGKTENNFSFPAIYKMIF